MKSFFLVCTLLLLQSCSVGMPKYMAYDNFKQMDTTKHTLKDHPYMFYCFSKDQKQLQSEFTDTYNECVENAFLKIPGEVTIGDHAALAQGIANCTYEVHAYMNMNFFSTAGLSEKQKEQCEKYKVNVIDKITYKIDQKIKQTQSSPDKEI